MADTAPTTAKMVKLWSIILYFYITPLFLVKNPQIDNKKYFFIHDITSLSHLWAQEPEPITRNVTQVKHKTACMTADCIKQK